jgi:hypothetical protein
VDRAIRPLCVSDSQLNSHPVPTRNIKVLRALEKPHVKGKFHEHKLNRVLIYLQPGRQRFEYQDGRTAKVIDWRAGEAN